MYCGFIALFREAEGCQTQPPIVYSVIVKLLQNLQRNNLMFFHLRDVLYFYVEKNSLLRDSCYLVAKFAWTSQGKIQQVFVCAVNLGILKKNFFIISSW